MVIDSNYIITIL